MRDTRFGPDTDRPQQVSELLPEVWDELRRIARAQLRGERAGHTLQPTALVNEAYFRLARVEGERWSDPQSFCALAARAMRQVLIDHARRRQAAKRGAREEGLLEPAPAPLPVDLLALDELLARLRALSPRQCQIVELRFLAGFTLEETAEELGLSTRTVQRDWRLARAWLRRELEALDG